MNFVFANTKFGTFQVPQTFLIHSKAAAEGAFAVAKKRAEPHLANEAAKKKAVTAAAQQAMQKTKEQAAKVELAAPAKSAKTLHHAVSIRTI